MRPNVIIVHHESADFLLDFRRDHRVRSSVTPLTSEDINIAKEKFDTHCGSICAVVTENEEWYEELEGFPGLERVLFHGASVDELLITEPRLLWKM